MEDTSLKSRVQVFIKCADLKDVEVFSKSDPFVEVYDKKNNHLSIIGKTEVIWDTLNPKFTTCIEMDYYFEVEKFLCFRVFDMNLENDIEVKGDFLGECEYTLGSIVGSRGNWLTKELLDQKGKSTKGSIYVRAEEIDEGNFDIITIQFEGNSLVFKEFMCFRVFKPMFHICRMMERDEHQIVYSSEHSRGKNPRWKPLKKCVRELTAGDFGRPMVFQLLDHSRSGKHKLIGSFNFTLAEIKDNNIQSFRVLDDYRMDVGEVKLVKVEISKEPSFLDYIYGGCQINLVIGIDFTSSNGHPSGPSSLHYTDPRHENQYQVALRSVGEILLNYDTDKQVPVYGFGAQVNGEVKQCFALNFDEDEPSVNDIEGIMNAYKQGIAKIKLAGPTNFAPIINTAVNMAKDARVDQINQQYFILLMLTDGMISDLQDTVDTIVRATAYPLSLIIVGVGNADFQSMEILDGDDGMLKDSQSRMAERDIVQFVPYNSYKDDPVALTREVLAEVPREILNFFQSRKWGPNPKLDMTGFHANPLSAGLNVNDIHTTVV